MRDQRKLRTIHAVGLRVCLRLCLMALSLAGCRPQPQTSTMPVATPVMESGLTPSQGASESIRANGVLLPARRIELSFGVPGIVGLVDVEIGETVGAGQILARLDDTEAQLAVRGAEAELAIAQANFALAASSIAAEQATASLELIQAQQALDALYDGASLTRSAALQEIAEASEALEQASYLLYYYNVPPGLSTLDSLEAVSFSWKELERARAAFAPYSNAPSGDPVRKALKEKVDQAQSDHNSAVRRLELEARKLAAEVRLEQARQEYDACRAGPDPEALALAEARLKNAVAQWEHAGGENETSQQLALAEAQLNAARLKLEMAQARLDQLALRTPIEAVVSAVQVASGEWAVPGATAIEALDLSHWRVETRNVSELQIGGVKIGQVVRVWVNAFGNDTLSGRVIAISPEAVVQQGDTTYTLVIGLDPTELNLRPGMTVQVEILGD